MKRNASNTPSNTHFLTHSLWLVKIHMSSTKSCRSHINLVGPIWILTNQRVCVEKCVLEDALLAFLYLWDMFPLYYLSETNIWSIQNLVLIFLFFLQIVFFLPKLYQYVTSLCLKRSFIFAKFFSGQIASWLEFTF